MVTGGCLCGAVRYRTEAEPIVARLCWCRVCQYFATGNAAVGVCLPSAGLSVVGETRDYASVADSGNRMHRRFCPTCGTHLFSAFFSAELLIMLKRAGIRTREVGVPHHPRTAGKAKGQQPKVILRAMNLAEARALRGYDAVQLSAALEIYDQAQALGWLSPTFVCADLRLNAAAQMEGLSTDDPNSH